jgi:hypothetical protein
VCKGCVLGKYSKTAFLGSDSRFVVIVGPRGSWI